MTQELAPAADPTTSLPPTFRSWSLDGAATASELTGRKLLFIVLGLAASSVTLVAAALVGTGLLVVRVAEMLR